MQGKIAVVGLGPGSRDLMSVGGMNKIKSSSLVYLRTAKHPVVADLEKEGLKYTSFDDVYMSLANFEAVYEEITNRLIEKARTDEVVYAVPGNPFVAETTVTLLLEKARKEGIDIEVIPAISCLDILYSRLEFDPNNGLKVLDGLQLDKHKPDVHAANFITQVYNKFVASEVKLTLAEVYPDDYPITVVRAAGIPDLERIEQMPLYELDRIDWVDHLTTVYLKPFPEGEIASRDFYSLVWVLEKLRGEDGCPWDREQTHQSLKKYLIEETYEVIDALESEDIDGVCEELGDLLLQIVFHAQIAREEETFTIEDVVQGIVEKMIRRHPHVFSDVIAEDSQTVLDNWEKIKQVEKGKEKFKSLLDGVPDAFPSLLKASKVQAKAAKVGFDWDNLSDVVKKVFEEAKEFRAALKEGIEAEISEEFGDLLFALVNLARFVNVEPELALQKTINKFRKRFAYIEKKAKEEERELDTMTLEEMDKFWDEAKNAEI